MKIAVAGATGRIGRRAAEILRSSEYDVVAISFVSVGVIVENGRAKAFAGVERTIDVVGEPHPTGRPTLVLHHLGPQPAEGPARAGRDVRPHFGRMLRAQFHTFVSQPRTWGKHGDASYVPKIRTQLAAAQYRCPDARRPAHHSELAPAPGPSGPPTPEIADQLGGNVTHMTELLAAR